MLLAEKTRADSAAAFIEYHADDFGLFPAQSRRILNCHTQGRLNGISILPNAEDLEACMALLEPVREEIAVTIHLNLIEGRCLTAPGQGMTDPDGTLRGSFGKLLLRSYLPGRAALKGWLKEELRAQIRAVAAYLPEDVPLRLDSHAHYHMLPVVFDALMEVIGEEGWKVSYIRIPREYLSLYRKHLRQLHDLSAINLVKVTILNLLALRNERKYKDYLDTLEKRVFLGVFLSGRMYRENVEPVLADAMALAKEKGQKLEILAHPGGVEELEDIQRLTNADDLAFLTSDHRRREMSLFENRE